jgi:hypothetical protein
LKSHDPGEFFLPQKKKEKLGHLIYHELARIPFTGTFGSDLEFCRTDENPTAQKPRMEKTQNFEVYPD